MTEEIRPLPKVARTALTLGQANFGRFLAELANNTLEVMSLDPADGWTCDFDRGLVVRVVADPPQPPVDTSAAVSSKDDLTPADA